VRRLARLDGSEVDGRKASNQSIGRRPQNVVTTQASHKTDQGTHPPHHVETQNAVLHVKPARHEDAVETSARAQVNDGIAGADVGKREWVATCEGVPDGGGRNEGEVVSGITELY